MAGIIKMPTTCSYDKTVRFECFHMQMMNVSSFSECPAKVFCAAFSDQKTVRPLSHGAAGISVSHEPPGSTGSTRNVVKGPIDRGESLYPGFCFCLSYILFGQQKQYQKTSTVNTPELWRSKGGFLFSLAFGYV